MSRIVGECEAFKALREIFPEIPESVYSLTLKYSAGREDVDLLYQVPNNPDETSDHAWADISLPYTPEKAHEMLKKVFDIPGENICSVDINVEVDHPTHVIVVSYLAMKESS